MKQKIEEIISKLQTDEFFAISVSNIDNTGSEFRVVTNATNDFLTEKYGSAVNFFETLFEAGISKIKVYPKKQNGKVQLQNGVQKINYKPAGIAPFEVEFSAKEKPVQQKEVIPAVPIQPQPVVPVQNYGMNGMGLGHADIYKIQDYDKVVRDLERIKAERNVLREEKQKLERKIFEQEVLGEQSVRKTEAQEKMLNSPIASTVIQLLAAKVMPLAPTETQHLGLGAGLSQVKQLFISMDDDFLSDLIVIANGMQNSEFDAELTELLKKHNLLPNEAV